ncbi:hypothetical protein RRG08_013581 [Elysia crispata]|uniref:Uncharacterized protein n=1 Tax=Elysia crispata TaxID=231223 RepID=A0AAE0Y3L5_9GAST|nr:hypothetical protein RRG08_013581 [Elysia crispata]
MGSNLATADDDGVSSSSPALSDAALFQKPKQLTDHRMTGTDGETRDRPLSGHCLADRGHAASMIPLGPTIIWTLSRGPRSRSFNDSSWTDHYLDIVSRTEVTQLQ